MSAKVSSSMSVNAGSASASMATKATPSPGATIAGSAGADGVSSAAGSRNSSGAGSSTGDNTGTSARFSVAMADAAQAGDHAVNAQVRVSKQATDDSSSDAGGSGTKPDTKADARDTSAADANNAADDAGAASAHDAVTNALPAATQNAVSLKITVPDQPGNARGARTAVGAGGGARAAGKDMASAATTDPVALAMLLALSGMQMSGGAGADDASDNVASSSADGGARGRPAIAVTSAGMPSAQAARDAPPAALDAATSAIANNAALSDGSAALSGNSTTTDSQSGPTSIMTGASGLPDLVRSFTNDVTQPAMVQATISVPVASGSWPHAVAAQVHWFVNNDVQSATLRLSPEHLGPVEVHIDVQKSQVNVSFSAAHADTRAALEQTVPRLREIFASGGLTLGQTHVQQDPRPGSQSAAQPVRATFAHAQTVEPVAVAAAQSLGLVDEYV
jgi:flagellar hook-length control protein FliK